MNEWPNIENRKILQNTGVMYIGSDRNYIDIAAVSARSLKQSSGAPCCIFTRDEEYAKAREVFDYVLPLTPDNIFSRYFLDSDRLPSVKMLCLAQSPFSKTLYLDGDTYVVGSLSDVFHLLETNDILVTNDSVTQMQDTDQLGRQKHTKLLKLTNPRYYNSGIFGYSDSLAASDFITGWIEDFVHLSNENPHSGNWVDTNCQICLNRVIRAGSLEKPDLRYQVLPNTIYNVTKRMIVELKKQDKLRDTKIFHTLISHQWVQQGNSIEKIHEAPSLEIFRRE